MSLMDRLKRSWNAFTSRDPTEEKFTYRNSYVMSSYSSRPDRMRFSRGNERSIVTAIYNRIAVDVASVPVMHVRLGEDGRYNSIINSGFNNCITTEANIDQTGRAFMQDVVMTMLDEGCVVIVPTDTSDDPTLSESYDIISLRTGRVVQWYPSAVRVKVYNERTGKREEITLPKRTVAVVENPLYAIINEPNSVLQRLIRKLNILDVIDEQSGSGKLNIIVQLPYITRTPARQNQAAERLRTIEDQLTNSPYGIAYIDSTEKITQLNRSVDNNMLSQIEYLTNMLYGQLGISQAILDGSANEQQMLNYNNRTIEPILSAIVDEMYRKFLSKTARTQGQSIKFYRDPFKLVPMNEIAEIADKFTRNEILSANEVRQGIGYRPSSDPRADELINSNNVSKSEDEVGKSYGLKDPDDTNN